MGSFGDKPLFKPKEKIMPVDFDALARETLADLVKTGSDFWDKLNEEQIPIVEQAVKDLAKASLNLVTEPDNAEIHKESIRFIKSTLASESTLAALLAAERLRSALMGALSRLTAVGLSLL